MITRKQIQQQLNRFYTTSNPCPDISSIIGISRMEFDAYIDKYKQPDMDRINYGKTWQFDHIVPVHLFNLFKDNELCLCYNYMNILPLYNRDNKYKGGSVHFSLHLLQNRLKEYPDNKELPLLINICQEQIDMYWSKYK